MSKMIDLEQFAGGALTEKFNIALREVLENIADPNTPWKNKRKLTIDLDFLPNEDRELTMVDIVAKTKLVPAKQVSTMMLIDRDGKGGIIASEYKNQLKGQQYIEVDEDTGEIISKSENEPDMKGIKLVK